MPQEYTDQFYAEWKRLQGLVRCFPYALPHQTLYECYHAHVHMVRMYNSPPNNDDKEKYFDRALSHCKRAQLDYCKIILLKIHATLQGKPEIFAFVKAHATARGKEIGLEPLAHHDVINGYSKVIQDYFCYLPQMTHSIRATPSATSSLQSRFAPSLKLKELFFQWCRLESYYAGVVGQRDYDIVLAVMQIMLTYDTDAAICDGLSMNILHIQALLSIQLCTLAVQCTVPLLPSTIQACGSMDTVLRNAQATYKDTSFREQIQQCIFDVHDDLSQHFGVSFA